MKSMLVKKQVSKITTFLKRCWEAGDVEAVGECVERSSKIKYQFLNDREAIRVWGAQNLPCWKARKAHVLKWTDKTICFYCRNAVFSFTLDFLLVYYFSVYLYNCLHPYLTFDTDVWVAIILHFFVTQGIGTHNYWVLLTLWFLLFWGIQTMLPGYFNSMVGTRIFIRFFFFWLPLFVSYKWSMY